MSKISNMILLLCLVIVYFAFPVTITEAKTNCWVTDIDNPTNPLPPPPGCASVSVNGSGRGTVACKSGESNANCAYRNVIDFTSICCRWTGKHKGVDLMAVTNVPQYAPEEMTIISIDFSGCYKPPRFFRDVGTLLTGQTYFPGTRKVYPGPGSTPCPDDSGSNTGGQRHRDGNSSGWNVLTRGSKSGRNYYYFHQVTKSPLVEGSTVHAGDLIGYTGETGHTPGGPHLHFQVSRPNCYKCWDNPDIMLQNYPNL